MKSQYLNHSSEKTKQLIRNTFSKLVMEKKEIAKITVAELVKRADINRGTFYNHYDNIYNVAEDLENEVIQVLVESSYGFNSLEELYQYFDTVIEYLKNNEEMYKMLLSSKEALNFSVKLNGLLQKNLYSFLSKNPPKNTQFLKEDIIFYTDGILNYFFRYFKGELNCSLNDLNQYMKRWFNILFIHS